MLRFDVEHLLILCAVLPFSGCVVHHYSDAKNDVLAEEPPSNGEFSTPQEPTPAEELELAPQVTEVADLESADLESADLESADLESADLESADLESTDLESADLESADLGSADLESTDVALDPQEEPSALPDERAPEESALGAVDIPPIKAQSAETTQIAVPEPAGPEPSSELAAEEPEHGHVDPDKQADSGDPLHQKAALDDVLIDPPSQPAEDELDEETDRPAMFSRDGQSIWRAPVLDLFHEEIGSLSDLAIDPETGRVAWVIVDVRGPPDILVPVAPENVRKDRNNLFVLRVTEEELLAEEARQVEGKHIRRVYREPSEQDEAVSKAAQSEAQDPIRAIFKAQEPQRLTGTAQAVSTSSGRLLIQLREENNHYHRVVLGPPDFVTAAGRGFEDILEWGADPEAGASSTVQVQAVQGRDDEGILWVAASIESGEQILDLRNEDTGEPEWPSVKEPEDPKINTTNARPPYISSRYFSTAEIEVDGEDVASAVGTEMVFDSMSVAVSLIYTVTDSNGRPERKRLDIQMLEVIKDRLRVAAAPPQAEQEAEPPAQGGP